MIHVFSVADSHAFSHEAMEFCLSFSFRVRLVGVQPPVWDVSFGCAVQRFDSSHLPAAADAHGSAAGPAPGSVRGPGPSPMPRPACHPGPSVGGLPLLRFIVSDSSPVVIRVLFS